MSFSWLLGVFVLAVTFGASLCSHYEYKTHFFETKVDHFGYANNDTYKMRYLVADQYWDHNGGPIFFYTGNEGSIDVFANNTGLMWDWAPKFDALLVFAEHRYYGKSMPYGDLSYDGPKHSGYLTVEQALADYAELLEFLKKTIPGATNSQVVSFGGSYGGMLAAWFRMKYPHVTVAALAASAPILQFQGLTPCNALNDVVTSAFRQESERCVAQIRRSWIVMEKMAASEDGRKALTRNFRLCELLGPGNYTAFRDWLTNIYTNLAMVNYPYANEFLAPVPGHPVGESCKFLDKTFEDDDTLLEGVFRAISVFQNYTGSKACNDIKDVSGTLDDAGWNIQSCNEMVMPMCSDGQTDMFFPNPWNLTQVRKDCERKYGMTPDVNKAVLMFGGKNISAASNIIFSNGDIDPWSAGGVLKTVSDSVIAVYMEGAAHHLDLREPNPADPESVKHARIVEEMYIRRWLREASV